MQAKPLSASPGFNTLEYWSLHILPLVYYILVKIFHFTSQLSINPYLVSLFHLLNKRFKQVPTVFDQDAILRLPVTVKKRKVADGAPYLWS